MFEAVSKIKTLSGSDNSNLSNLVIIFEEGEFPGINPLQEALENAVGVDI
jgi:hypothetical protein